jgi:O-antigen/teichoic acid export membrane protein
MTNLKVGSLAAWASGILDTAKYHLLLGGWLLFLTLGLQFLSFLIIARGLGLTQFGQLSALFALTGPASELVGLGSSERLLEQVSRDTKSFPVALADSLLTIILSGPVVIGAVTLLSHLLVPDLPLSTTLFLVATETLAARSITHVGFILIAHGATFLVNLQGFVIASLRCILAAGVFFVARNSNLETYAVVYSVAMFATVALFMAGAMRRYGLAQFSRGRTRPLLGLSFAAHNFCSSLSQSVDRIGLSIMLPYGQIGIYNAGARMLQVAIVPVTGLLLRDTYPNFFRIGKSGIGATFAYALSLLPRVCSITAICVLGAVGISYLLPVLLGPKYSESAPIGAIMVMAGFPIALQYLGGDILTGAGRQSVRAGLTIASIPIISGVIILGSWLFGVFGAAVCFVLVQCLMAIVQWIVAHVLNRRSQTKLKPAS